MLRAFIEFLSMIKWNDFVTATVYDKNGSLDVTNSVNIRKFVEGQSPSKIETFMSGNLYFNIFQSFRRVNDGIVNLVRRENKFTD